MEKRLDYKKIGGKVKKIRQQKKITREKLSEMIGISAMYLGQLERGERRGGINNYIQISNALNISLDYLFLDELNTVEVVNNQVFQKLQEALKALDGDKKILFLNIVLDVAKRLKES